MRPPSIVLSYAAYSPVDGALPPGAAESQAPFGRSESPHQASNLALYSAASRTLPSGEAESQNKLILGSSLSSGYIPGLGAIPQDSTPKYAYYLLSDQM